MGEMLRIDFVTLFPEMVLGAVGHSILKRATEAEIVQFGAANPREFTHDKHRTVDDNPFGGGPGMLMKCEPVAASDRFAQALAIFRDMGADAYAHRVERAQLDLLPS